jgi:conjugative transfer signal peptidase TraF
MTASSMSSPTPPPRIAGWGPIAGVGIAVAIALTSLLATAPQVLINTTASEPEGLYRRIGAPAGVGRLVAFKAPAAAFPYADAHLAYLRQVPMLKAVAAGPGDQVCARDGRLVIAGRDRGPIAWADREGRALPHWNGCRRLAASELFVFSARVPNSFDSRYFGPIDRQDVLGVYTPLVVASEGSR